MLRMWTKYTVCTFIFINNIYSGIFFLEKNVTLYNNVLLVNLLTMIKTFVAVFIYYKKYNC